MSDPVDVTVDADDESESVRIHDDGGEVEAGDATVRFSFSGTGDDVQSSGDDEQSPDDNDDGDEPRRIVDLDSVPTDSTLVFEARDGRRGVNCILHRSGDAVAAWRNSVPTSPRSRWTRVGARSTGGPAGVSQTRRAVRTRRRRLPHGPCAGDASTVTRSRFGTATCT